MTGADDLWHTAGGKLHHHLPIGVKTVEVMPAPDSVAGGTEVWGTEELGIVVTNRGVGCR